MGFSDSDRKEYWASLALKHTPSIGLVTIKRLLDHYGSAYEAVQGVREWKLHKLASDRQIHSYNSEAWRGMGRDEWDGLARLGCGLLLWTDDDYPDRLRDIHDPPPFLYLSGDRSLLKSPCVAVVGSRTSTKYGRYAASALSRGLSDSGICVVSGMAYGIDRQAHLAGLEGPGSSIGVLGCGLDIDYPQGNQDVRERMAKTGLLMTECAPGTPPIAQAFPKRNRIISGLSMGVVVVEGGRRSGSLITARLAMEQGREVFAVGGPVGESTFSGGNALINEGAKLIASAEDILLECFPHLVRDSEDASSPPPPRDEVIKDKSATRRDRTRQDPYNDMDATEPASVPDVDTSTLGLDEACVLDHLLAHGGEHIDELCRAFDWPSERMSRTLTMLELQGHVRRFPGMRFAAVQGRGS